MGKHTPGPWVVADQNPDGILDRAVMATGFYVATVHDTASHEGCWDADARLIAAAPDMLNALKVALTWSDADWVGHEIVTAAVAKAEGQPTRPDGPVLREGA